MPSRAKCMRTGAFCGLTLLLAVATAHAGVVFNTDLTGACQLYPGSAGTITGTAAGLMTNESRGLSLWGDCTFVSTESGTAGITMSWHGTAAPGSSLLYGESIPFGFGYQFSVTGPSGTPLGWTLLMRFGRTSPPRSDGFYGAGSTGPGGGDVFAQDPTLSWAYNAMTVNNWYALLTVTFQAEPGDTLTVSVPQHSSIDFNTPSSAVPEPSAVVLLLTGLGGTFAARGRRNRRQ